LFAYKFTGKERDTESGLDYFGARYYASSMGRFMSPDWAAKAEPVPYAKLDNPQSLNLYAYMRNNPLGGVDQDGHFPTSAHTEWTASQLVSLGLDQGNANSFSKTVNFAIDNWEGGAMGLFNGSLHGMAGAEAYSVARETLLSDATTIHDGNYLQAAVALATGDHLVQDYVAHAGMEGPFAEVQHVERYGFGDANPNSMMGEEAKFQTSKFQQDFLAGLKANYGDAAPGVLSKILDAAKSGVVGPAVEQEHSRVEGAIAADQKKRDHQ
jgi:RHS repeat-associated protein